MDLVIFRASLLVSVYSILCEPMKKLLIRLGVCKTIKTYMDNETEIDVGFPMNQTHHALVLFYAYTLQTVISIMSVFS